MSLFSFQDEFNINTWSNRKQNKLASLFQWILFSIYYLNIANDQQNTNQKKNRKFLRDKFRICLYTAKR